MEKNNTQKLEWSAPEYEEKVQGNDWFWALGIIVVATAVTAIIFNNYFFAILIILGGVLLGYFTIKKPDIVHYELNEVGLRMKNRLHPYKNIKSFWVQRVPHPMLFIKTGRVFMPIIPMPIELSHADEIQNLMLSNTIPEEEMKEHPGVKIMETLGF